MPSATQRRIIEAIRHRLAVDDYELLDDRELANTGILRAVTDTELTSPYWLRYSFSTHTVQFSHDCQVQDCAGPRFGLYLSYVHREDLVEKLDKVVEYLKGH